MAVYGKCKQHSTQVQVGTSFTVTISSNRLIPFLELVRAALREPHVRVTETGDWLPPYGPNDGSKRIKKARITGF